MSLGWGLLQQSLHKRRTEACCLLVFRTCRALDFKIKIIKRKRQLQPTYTPKSTRGPAIEHTLVFSHSMANLVVAYAIKTQACGKGVDLSNATSAWYALGAPMSGAKSANWIDEICATREFAFASPPSASKSRVSCEGVNHFFSFSAPPTNSPRYANERTTGQPDNLEFSAPSFLGSLKSCIIARTTRRSQTP